jgi:hypothetical protein
MKMTHNAAGVSDAQRVVAMNCISVMATRTFGFESDHAVPPSERGKDALKGCGRNDCDPLGRGAT